MPLYHSVLMSLSKQPAAEYAKALRSCCHNIFNKGGWVRAVENHGIRPLPYRIRSPYSPDDERYHWDARVVSLYFDAPVATKNELELALRLDEQIIRYTTMKTKSVTDEVLSLKPSNPWNGVAGVEVKKRAPKKKRSRYGRDEEGSARQEELEGFIDKYLSKNA
mmetsp:Transcript_43232/g.87416  ORF Transcript_43232/g.87416 Transcript_43232/m.87416 type:complete len:164 (-) Transcript_43232:153-644(-)